MLEKMSQLVSNEEELIRPARGRARHPGLLRLRAAGRLERPPAALGRRRGPGGKGAKRNGRHSGMRESRRNPQDDLRHGLQQRRHRRPRAGIKMPPSRRHQHQQPEAGVGRRPAAGQQARNLYASSWRSRTRTGGRDGIRQRRLLRLWTGSCTKTRPRWCVPGAATPSTTSTRHHLDPLQRLRGLHLLRASALTILTSGSQFQGKEKTEISKDVLDEIRQNQINQYSSPQKTSARS